MFPLYNIILIIFIFTCLCNRGAKISWDYGFGAYFLIFWVVTIINMALALAFTLIVERPFMNLSKAIDI